jgi:hypothetical protein
VDVRGSTGPSRAGRHENLPVAGDLDYEGESDTIMVALKAKPTPSPSR